VDKENKQMATKYNKIKTICIEGEDYETTSLTTLKKSKTNRGFGLYTFIDKYGVECSLQDSSLATEPAIWFGVNEPNPKKLTKEKGWEKYELPEDIHMSTRMHLTQEQVKKLLPILTFFAETGNYVRDYKKEKK
jgi:hypothetical protein